MTVSTATLLLHSRKDSAGSLPEILEKHSLNVDIRYIDDKLPQPADNELIIVMGSIESPYDHTLPWLADELAWLKTLVARDHPVFGICFGSQLLARALGGETYRNYAPEIGWTPIDSQAPEILPSGPWLNFHFDAFTAPPSARLLASTDMSHQAYQHRRQMGVQFHPEITPAMFDSWLAAWEKTASGCEFLAEHADLIHQLGNEITQQEANNRHRCTGLISTYLETISQ